MSREREARIIQIMPISCPLWGVQTVHVPDGRDGYHYDCNRVYGFALVEYWFKHGPFEGDEDVDSRERSIYPIYLEDGTYFDASDGFSGWANKAFTFVEELPVTRDERDALEKWALEELEREAKAEEDRKQRQAEKAGANRANKGTTQ